MCNSGIRYGRRHDLGSLCFTLSGSKDEGSSSVTSTLMSVIFLFTITKDLTGSYFDTEPPMD